MSLSAHVRTRVCVILQVFTYDVLFNRLQIYYVQNMVETKLRYINIRNATWQEHRNILCKHSSEDLKGQVY